MQHSFDVDIAVKYGVHSAILLNNIAFWIAKNEANEVNFYDGNYWTYNSREAFSKLFPYMTPRQITYALDKLIDAGLIVTGNYNSSSYDRTLWYALTEKGKSILQNCKMEEPKKENGNNGNVKPIPYINTDKNKDTKPNNKLDPNLSIFDLTAEEEARLIESLNDFAEMRKKIKKPLTNRALQIIINKLSTLSNGNVDIAIEILENSIANSWQGVFPLKQEDIKAKKEAPANDIIDYPF